MHGCTFWLMYIVSTFGTRGEGGRGGARVMFPMSTRKMGNLSRNLPGAESQGDCICWALHIACDRSAKVCFEKNPTADLGNFTSCQWSAS